MKGDYGESIANMFLGMPIPSGEFAFRTVKIGGTWPTIDIFAETLTESGQVCGAVFQVKTTEKPWSDSLSISISKRNLNRLAAYRMPTYLVGIAFNRENPTTSRAFVEAVYGTYERSKSKISTSHPLNPASLGQLKLEVLNFWSKLDIDTLKREYQSKFV